jgi:hypothetical protein
MLKRESGKTTRREQCWMKVESCVLINFHFKNGERKLKFEPIRHGKPKSVVHLDTGCYSLH